jgi:uncharacterized phage-associated protein
MMRNFKYKKATQALNYLANKNGGKFNKMKAIKLIWLADRLHLRRYGRTITGDTYFAMPNGPVASSTRDILESKYETDYVREFLQQDQDRNEFISVNQPYLKVFSKTDLQAIDDVFEKYGNKGKYILRDMSHDFPEWKKFEAIFEADEAKRLPIDLNDFFINFHDESGLFMGDQELIQASKEMYEEYKKQQSLLSTNS